MWFRTCARYELILETSTSKICSNHIMEVKKKSPNTKAEQIDPWRWTRNSEKIDKMEKVSLDISRKEELSGTVRSYPVLREVSWKVYR